MTNYGDVRYTSNAERKCVFFFSRMGSGWHSCKQTSVLLEITQKIRHFISMLPFLFPNTSKSQNVFILNLLNHFQEWQNSKSKRQMGWCGVGGVKCISFDFALSCVSVTFFTAHRQGVKHLQVIISEKHQQAGTCFRSPTKSQGAGLLAWPWVSSSLNKCNMDQPQHHARLTQCLLVDCSVQINYRALRACKTPHFFRNTFWGWRPTVVACVCAR